MDQLLPFALTLGDGATRAFDVRTRTGMAAIDEERACPDVDGEVVLSRERVREAAEQQLFDARFAVDFRRLRGRGV